MSGVTEGVLVMIVLFLLTPWGWKVVEVLFFAAVDFFKIGLVVLILGYAVWSSITPSIPGG